MAYDPVTQRTIMFGGDRRRWACFSDTWAYDSSKNRWTELNSETHPTPRVYLCMAYDPSTERVIMFGGAGTGGRAIGYVGLHTIVVHESTQAEHDRPLHRAEVDLGTS